MPKRAGRAALSAKRKLKSRHKQFHNTLADRQDQIRRLERPGSFAGMIAKKAKKK